MLSKPQTYLLINMSRNLVLTSLKCNKTEDNFGHDECYLEIFADSNSKIKAKLEKSMKKGETWDINQSFDFSETAMVKLYDADKGKNSKVDPDDFLGSLIINDDVCNGASAKFTQDGADYELEYKVEDKNNEQQRTGTISKVKVELLDIDCRNTEDETSKSTSFLKGKDEFYLIGGVGDSKTKKMEPILTSPVGIQAGETKYFRETEKNLYHGPVDKSTVIYLQMAAYDKDVASSWSKYEKTVSAIGDTLAKAVTITATGVAAVTGAGATIASLGAAAAPSVAATGAACAAVGALSGAATKAAVETLSTLAKLDDEDLLGEVSTEIKVEDLKLGSKVYSWAFEGTGHVSAVSDWEYVVRYRITAEE